MTKTTIKKLSLTALAVLVTGGALFAQNLKVAPGNGHWTGPVVPYRMDWPGTPIFTNLSPPSTGAPTLWDCDTGGYYVLGPANCLAFDEQWIAVTFWTGPNGGTARRLQAAITKETTCGSTSAAKVLLGIYTDTGTFPHAPATALIEKPATVPVFACGALAQANLGTAGVVLAANTQYWLTARTAPGGANAGLTAVWNPTNGDLTAFDQPAVTGGWLGFSGLTPAGAVLP